MFNSSIFWTPSDLEMLVQRYESLDAKQFPPHNVYDKDGFTFLEFSCAGYSPDQLSVVLDNETLTVEGKGVHDDSTKYVYKGISQRSFKRKFTLKPHGYVAECAFDNGILMIKLGVEVPEELKPKKIPITTNNKLVSYS